MKKITQLLQSLFAITSYDCVCDNCSYYNDPVVDDNSAFVPHVKSQQGWIQRYVMNKLSR